MILAALESRAANAGSDGRTSPSYRGLAGVQLLEFTPFDPVNKRNESTVRESSSVITVSKGAVQVMLRLVKSGMKKKKYKALAAQVRNDVAAFSERGIRTLAVARKCCVGNKYVRAKKFDDAVGNTGTASSREGIEANEEKESKSSLTLHSAAPAVVSTTASNRRVELPNNDKSAISVSDQLTGHVTGGGDCNEIGIENAGVVVSNGGGGGEWEFVGLLCFIDAPRQDAQQTILDLKALGVAVKMMSGDSALVSRTTARRLGMGDHFKSASQLPRLNTVTLAGLVEQR